MKRWNKRKQKKTKKKKRTRRRRLGLGENENMFKTCDVLWKPAIINILNLPSNSKIVTLYFFLPS